MTWQKKPAQGFVSIGMIPRDEIWKIYTALLFDRRNQLDDFEFTVRCRGGRRCWQIANDNIIFNIYGGYARFEGTYALGAEFMSNCCAFRMSSVGMELTIDDNVVTASSPIGTLAMADGGRVHTEFRSINQRRDVEAQIAQECLSYISESCPSFPLEHFDIDEMRDKFPTTTVSIGDNLIKFEGKFNRYGYKNLTTTAPAVTSGHGSITVSSLLLGQSLQAFEFDRDNPNVTITCDPIDGEFIELTTNTEYVAIRKSRVFAATKLG